MKTLRSLVENIDRITKQKNITILEADGRKYVAKENKNKMIYDYLSSRGFIYYLEPVKRNDDYNLYEYVEETDTPNEQRALDIIHLMALLHKKTTYYKEINLDEIKEIYEEITNKIMYLFEYYQNLQETLEQEEFFSPSSYMLLREISFLYSSLHFCKNTIDHWYETMKQKKDIRIALVHCNLDISHIIESENKYLISWDKAKKDIPIYDFYHFFTNCYEEIDFSLLYKEYILDYSLTKEEEDLLFVLISIPDKIILDLDEYNNCLKIRKLYLKLNRANNIILNNRSKNKKQEQP